MNWMRTYVDWQMNLAMKILVLLMPVKPQHHSIVFWLHLDFLQQQST